MPKKKKSKKQAKLIKVIIYLISLIIVFNIAPNYEKNEDYYIEDKINLIIDNNNITKNLEHDLFISHKKVIYMSIQDISNYFDDTVTYNEERKEIETTYGEKEVKLPINKNIIKINDRDVDVLSGAVEKDGVYYIPITAMKKIYELDIEYIKEEQILLLDSLTKKLVKADISKSCDVKYKTTTYSKTVDKLKRADKVVVIEDLENNWSKIRTKNGKIGYVKTNILQNEIYVRDDIEVIKNNKTYNK